MFIIDRNVPRKLLVACTCGHNHDACLALQTERECKRFALIIRKECGQCDCAMIENLDDTATAWGREEFDRLYALIKEKP